MKRVLIFIVTIFVALISFGCKSNNEILINSNSGVLKNEEKEIKFKVDQILLSKSFQSTEPSIEVLTKGNNTRILASLGLTESSGVKINKIVRRGYEVDIHVSGIYDNSDLQLAVPQVVLDIKKPRFDKIEDFKFNIVNDNYKLLKIKLGVNEALSKIQSHFKISSNGSPTINLVRSNDDILWNISYDTIFDRENPQIPLVNFSTSINANTGIIIESKKTFISSSIDDGHILDYVPNKHLLYRRSLKDSGTGDIKEQIWSYDLLTREKSMIFSSNLKINSAKYSTDLSYVSLIESSPGNTELYVIPRVDKRAYKIGFEDRFNPQILSWKDDNNLYLIENLDGKSIVFLYDVEKDITNRIAKVNKNIENLIIRDGIFLIVETQEDNYNKKISTTLDWKDFDFKDYGFSPQFIGKDKLGYLKKDEKLDNNSLFLHSLKNNNNINIIDGNISTFQVVSNKDITYVKKNAKHNNFTLSKYSLEDKETVDIAPLIGDRVYYDTERDIIYANIILPFENDKPEIIYLIDLSKLD